MLELANNGRRYIVLNHRPELDTERAAIETFDDARRATLYAQRLRSERVDVIDRVTGEYVARYPNPHYQPTHNV